MSDFRNDINEIKEFIIACFNKPCKSKENMRILERICAKADNVYLENRAMAIKNAYENSDSFKDAIIRLEKVCQDKPKCEQCPVNKYCNYFIKNAIDSADENAPKIVDLFCGAGGLSLGFMHEGFITSLANDIEPCCIDTYAHNHPETPRENIILGDINTVINNMDSLLRYPKVDVVIGGPPCQGFSMANRQRLIDDPRNQLYRSYVEVVNKVQPKVFVMENVKGMLSVSNQVLEDFKRIGYSVACKVLNARNFGVPQNRERLIFIGNRLGIENEIIFDEISDISEKAPKFVLADALYGLKPLQASRVKNATEVGCELSGKIIDQEYTKDVNEYITIINQGRSYGYVCNHKARYNNDRDIEIYGRLNEGDKSDDPKIADIMPYSRRNDIFKDKYFKLESYKACKTITAHMKFDCNMYIHPTQARGLTPREAARIQSYPDDYYFRGAYTKTYMQIGNSVPPLLGRAIASVIKKYIRGE